MCSKTIFFLPFFSMALAACGHSYLNPPAGYEQADEMTGTLLENVKKVTSGKFAENCDSKNLSKMTEIAKALDEKALEKTSLNPDLNSNLDEKWNHHALGPIQVKTPKQAKAASDQWMDVPSSWDALYQDYAKLKDQPASLEWAKLARETRELIKNDQRRVSGNKSYLRHEDGPQVKVILDLIENCRAKKNCAEPDGLDQFVSHYFSNNATYQAEALSIHSQTSSDGKKQATQHFYRRVKRDYETFFQVKPRPGVTRTSESVLTLVLDPTVFDSAKDQLASIIEGVWKSSGLSVLIQWGADPKAFKFIQDPGLEGRAYTNDRKREIHLFNDVAENAIAHEVGHTLGFKERSFTRWDGGTCIYTKEVNEADLMSSPATGKVQADEWQMLKDAYPVTASK
jgi:hypothetical protein